METLSKTATQISQEVSTVADIATELPKLVEGTLNAAVEDPKLAASTTTQSAVTAETSVTPHTTGSADDMLSCSMQVDFFKENISKMVFVHSGSWSSSDTRFKVLSTILVPESLNNDDTLPSSQTYKFFRYLRSGWHFKLFINVPPGCSGALAISFVPGGYRNLVSGTTFQRDASSILALPYAFADIRCSNEVDLVIPYTSFKNYVNYTTSTDDSGMFIVWVMSPVMIGTMSGAITYSVYGEMVEPDYQCPRPFNQGPAKRKTVFPPKNPPVKTHVQIDGATGCVNLSNVCSTGAAESIALAGESTVFDYATAGCASTINDLLEITRRWTVWFDTEWAVGKAAGERIEAATFQPSRMGLIGAIFNSFMYFKGSFEIKVLVFGSSFSSGRYQISWVPESGNSANFSLQQCRNSIYATNDIGCEATTLVLPFVHNSWRRETNLDYGRILLHCVNKLTHNQTSPSSVRMMVLVRTGPDMQLFCPKMPKLNVSGVGQQLETDTQTCFINYEIEKIKIQNESHSLVNNYFGRLTHVHSQAISASTVTSYNLTPDNIAYMFPLSCFAYWTGELVLCITNITTTPLMVSHQYANTTVDNKAALSALGAMMVPPNGSKTMNIPFYSPTPFRKTVGTDAFGTMYMFSESAGNVIISLALRNPQLAFPMPNKNYSVTNYSLGGWIQDLTECGDVESNPGPNFENRLLEFKGFYFAVSSNTTHGFLSKTNVRHLTCYTDGDQFIFSRHTVEVNNLLTKYREDIFSTQAGSFSLIRKKDWLGRRFSKIIERSHIKDLTTEGIEPNPGPATYTVERNTLTTRQIRSYDEDEEFYWTQDTYSGHKYAAKVLRVHLKSNGIPSKPVFTIKNTVIRCLRGNKVKTVITFDTANGTKVIKSVVPPGHETPLMWHEDILRCGDVEQNPGPRKWLTARHSYNLGEIRVRMVIHILISEEHGVVQLVGPVIYDRNERAPGGKKRRIVEYYYDPNEEPYRKIYPCHEECWVRDLTMDGDVESNPGPRKIVVVGPNQCGKTTLIRDAFGVPVEPSKNKKYSHDTYNTAFGEIIECRQVPKLVDLVDCFILVVRPGLEGYRELIVDMERSYPNWLSHSVIFFSQSPTRQHPEKYLEKHGFSSILFKCMGRVTDEPRVIEGLLKAMGNGPYFSHLFKLVYKNRGAYRHYGIKNGSTVYHLNTGDILQSALEGTATVHLDDDPQSWIESDETGYRNAMHVVNAKLVNYKFSMDSNCETFARMFVDSDSPMQGDRIKWGLTLAAASAFLFCSSSFSDQSPGLFHKLISAISNHFYSNLENIVMKTVIKTVCRLVCYLILYCHSPNLLTTGTLVALISMDLSSIEVDPKIRALCQSLADGEFAQFCSDVVELTGDPDYVELKNHIPKFANQSITLQKLQEKAIYDKMKWEEEQGPIGVLDHPKDCRCFVCFESKASNEGPKSFNEWSTAAKNVKWWVESLMTALEWIRDKLFPSNATKLVEELESKANKIALIMSLADEHITKCRTDKQYVLSKDTVDKHRHLVSKLVELNVDSFPTQLAHFQGKINTLLTRIQSLNLEPPLDYAHRPEPLGVWIQGSPGCGKSFLSNFLVKSLSKHYNWDAYTHPIASEHMDGYVSQEIHVFDDLGQNRQENDVALMCNLISSTPFIVPKANLESKGCRYQGRVVIATTNKRDFTSNILLDNSALQRRFPMVFEIRPKEKYRREDSFGRTRFNAVNATKDGSLERGDCWEMNVDAKNQNRSQDCWIPLDPKVLFEEICEEIDSRSAVANFMNQGVDIEMESDEMTEFDKLFPQTPKNFSRFRKYVGDSIASFKAFVERNRSWFLAAGALGTIISLSSFLIPIVRKWLNKDSSDENYSGKPGPIKIQNYKLPLLNQGQINLKPILNSLVNVETENGEVSTAICIGNKEIITYGHDSFVRVSGFRDEKVMWNLNNPRRVTISDQSMDLTQYTVDTNIQFKNINHKIYEEDYNGSGYLLWKEGSSYTVLPVENIHATNTLITLEGTGTEHTYSYCARTWKGACGAVLVGIVNGNPKILGIHIAGNKCMGVAARLFPMFNQGKATKIADIRPYFQPRKSKLEPSPVYESSNVAPAVLSKNDPRLDIMVDDVTKNAADKYTGNTFNPPKEYMSMAKAAVISKFSKVVKHKDVATYEEAIDSTILPIDWTTSSGHKYAPRKKMDLITDPQFRKDVMEVLETGSTYFTTYLKDELRPLSKVRVGKTRTIDAANFNYVIAYRMVMMKVVKQLFEDQDRITGFAPGVCPYTHWDSLYDTIHSNVLALDFSGYDGSLSDTLMLEAVEVLSCFHEQPDLARFIHLPTIYSENLVADEKWYIEGGMCSGSPCTTIINTICNLLVNYCVAFSYGLSMDEVHIAAYGDDTLFSTTRCFDVEGIEQRYMDWFGMKVTSSDKVSKITWQGKSQSNFLKRSPTVLYGTSKIVGALDIDSMMDHIQWTRGEFQSQLESFYLELCLHGPTVYGQIRSDLCKRAPSFNHPTFDWAYNQMKFICQVY
nr:MAG: polyprotein [Picornaviridae sp.]